MALAMPGTREPETVVRLEEGHTAGPELPITGELVKLMLSAKGGKLQQAH